MEYASRDDSTSALPALCSSFFDKGLLEWRLSTEAAVEFLSRLPTEAFLELSYDSLIENSIDSMSRIARFISIDDDPNVTRFVSANVKRQSSKLMPHLLSDKERTLGGPLLPFSLDGKGLTTRRR